MKAALRWETNRLGKLLARRGTANDRRGSGPGAGVGLAYPGGAVSARRRSPSRAAAAALTRVLVVAAHPDDEVLGAGGAIAWHRRRGDSVAVLIMSEGLGARYPTDQEARAAAGSQAFITLREECRRAHRVLRVTQTFQHQFPDNRFDSVDLLDLVKAVEAVKRIVRPQLVYTHYAGDLNIDHRLSCEAVLAACRPMARDTVERIVSFEVLSSTEWAPPRVDRAFVPNVFLDISTVLDRKLKAMACYRSELRRMPHPRSLAAIRHQAKLWGAKVGLGAAEAFMLLRERIPAT